MELIKEKEKEKLKKKNKKPEMKSNTNKNIFSNIEESSKASSYSEKDISETKEIMKRTKQKRVAKKHQNKYDIGNAVIDGSYDSFWKVLSKFLIDKVPLIMIIIIFIVIKKNPEMIRGTIIEKIFKKIYNTIMIIININ